jgi:hypothetical protein
MIFIVFDIVPYLCPVFNIILLASSEMRLDLAGHVKNTSVG